MNCQLVKTKFASCELAADIWEITPDLAGEMLDASRGNRSIRAQRVRDWTRALCDGTWEVITDDIGFDVDGYLVNGHHRLHACVHSGVSFKCGIKFGLSKTAYQKMDCGLVRAISERTGLDKQHAEVLRLAGMYLLAARRPSVAELDFIASTTGLLEAAERLSSHCGTTVKFFSCAPLRLAACAHIAFGKTDAHVQYAMDTYKNLVLMRVKEVSSTAQSLVGQFVQGDVRASNTVDTILRGFKVYDYEKRDTQKLIVKGQSNTAVAAELVHLLNFKTL